MDVSQSARCADRLIVSSRSCGSGSKNGSIITEQGEFDATWNFSFVSSFVSHGIDYKSRDRMRQTNDTPKVHGLKTMFVLKKCLNDRNILLAGHLLKK